MVSATVGPPIPAAAALGRELRQSLPAALVEALDKIGDQIEVEILGPLLCAASGAVSAGRRATVFGADDPELSRIGTSDPRTRSALDRSAQPAQH